MSARALRNAAASQWRRRSARPRRFAWRGRRGGRRSVVLDRNQPEHLVRSIDRGLRYLADPPHVVLLVEHARLEPRPLLRSQDVREVTVGHLHASVEVGYPELV